MLLAYLRDLFDYEHWATGRIIDALNSMDEPSPRAVQQLAHALAARQAWLMRLERGESFAINIWPAVGETEMSQLEQTAQQTVVQIAALLAKLTEADLERVYDYQSYSRKAEQRRLCDILIHMVNHGTYHRGYCSVFIREDGGQPVITDYIEYARTLPR